MHMSLSFDAFLSLPYTTGIVQNINEKATLDGISTQANKTTVTTEGSGAIEIDGTSKAVVYIATDAEVTEMINTALPAPSSGT